MHWLVTFSKSLTAEERDKILNDIGCQVDLETEPIAIDDDVVVEVDGPTDLPERSKSFPGIKAVYPSSEYTLYSSP